MKQAVHAFDRVIGCWVSSLPEWLRPLMLAATLIGQPPFTVGIAAAILGYGAALNKPDFILAGVIAITTLAITSLLKVFLRRARPQNEYVSKMLFSTFSFPSGHAAGSLVSFGLAAFIIGLKWPEFAAVGLVTAIILTFLVSLSRIYLGAHYASDIVGGWIVGMIGLIAILAIEW